MTMALQTFEGNVLHARILRAPIWTERQRLRNDLLRGVAEALLLESHPLCKLPEEPHIRPRLADGLDGLIGQLQEVVSVSTLDVRVLKEARGRQHVVGVIGCVVKEQVMHNGEQICPRQSSPNRVLIRRDRSWIRVVHKQRMDRRPAAEYVFSFRSLTPGL